jgi:beta-lactamase superfamily II metal-dependent hydrolase
MLLSANSIFSQSLKIHTIHLHGDAHLVQTPGGKTMLIDAGSPWHVDRVKSFIDSKGITSIDAVYLSHAHGDHYGGFTGEDGILATYHVSEFYGVDENDSQVFFNSLILPYSKNPDITYQVMKRGDIIELDPDLKIEILFPPDPYPNVGKNDGSAACMITDLRNGRKFIYIGDGMEQQHRDLVDFYGDDLRCDVLKYGHHTQFELDDDYSMGTFMEITQPRYGIITKQAMPENKPGHGELTQASFDKLYAYTWVSDTGLKSFMLGTHGHITVECPEDGKITISTSKEYIPPTVSASHESGIIAVPFTLTLTLSEPYHENRYPGERRGYYSLDDGLTWNEFLYPGTQLDITNTTTVMTRARDIYGNCSGELEYLFEWDETADPPPPLIISISPPNNATDVPVTSDIVIVFSQAMNRESVENALTITPALSNKEFAWTDSNVISVKSNKMEEATQYTVTIAGTATNLAGNELFKGAEISFTTASQAILNADIFGFEIPANKPGGAFGWWRQHPGWDRSEEQTASGDASMQFYIENYTGAVSTLQGAKAESEMLVPAGRYRMSLKVWLHPETTLTALRTMVYPWQVIVWDYSNVSKGEWVTLSQELIFEEALDDMRIQINSADQPEGLTGPQLFYVDDISFVEISPSATYQVNFGVDPTEITADANVQGAGNFTEGTEVQISKCNRGLSFYWLDRQH